MSINHINLDLATEHSTSQPAPTGTRRLHLDDTYGWQELIVVKNSSVGTLAVNTMVSFASGSSINVDVASAVADPIAKCAGVLKASLLTLEYGWAVRRGDTLCIADAAIAAANVALSVGSIGRLDDIAVAGIEHCIVGWALESATGAASTFRARLCLP